MITKNLSTLKICKLSQEQYDKSLADGTLDEDAIYLTPDDGSGSLGGIEVEITSLSGAIVHYSDENGNAYTQAVGSNGKTIISIPYYGTYSFYATLSGAQSPTVVLNVDTIKRYELKLLFYKYYGVKIAIGTSDPASAVTYIDDAAGMSAGWANWKNTSICKNIKPCVLNNGVVKYYLNPDNYTKKADGTTSTINSTTEGDVMVEIPKLGYKMTTDGTYHYIWVTDNPNAEGYCYAAHSKNAEGDCDKIYVGAYLGYNSGSKLYSVSGVSPTTKITLTNARTYATARGSGYELFSFYPLTLLQCLYLVIFKNRNSQAALGHGYVGGSAKTNTGATNSSAFMSGSTSSKTTHVKFLGIEDFWGNCLYWVDGIYSDSSRKLLTYYKNMSGTDNGSNYQYSCASGVTSNIGNYMNNIVGTNHGGFVAKSVSGSATTYYADAAGLYASRCAYFGGDWANDTNAGAFQLYVIYAASDSNDYIASRLVYKHVG